MSGPDKPGVSRRYRAGCSLPETLAHGTYRAPSRTTAEKGSVEIPVHPLAGVEGGLDLVVGGEPGALVKRLSVWVCRDFEPLKSLSSGNIDDVGDE